MVLDLPDILSHKKRFATTLLLSMFLNISLHYVLDDLHVPVFLDKVGLVLMAYSFGPIGTVISALLTAGLLSLTDIWYLFRSLTFMLLAILWSFGFLMTRKKQNNAFLVISWILTPIVVYASEILVFSSILYYPFKSDTMNYIQPFNTFVLQSIDGFLSFLLGVLILVSLGLKDLKKKQNLTIKYEALVIIILMLLSTTAGYMSYSSEKALVPYLPKPEGWVFVNVRMDFVWAPMGVRGSNNYYYPEGRFNASDPGYQVWFGIYWIQGKYGIYGNTYKQDEIFAFSIFDQDAWLSLYGLKTPKTTVHNITGVAWGTFKGYTALFMNGSYNSQSDVPPYEDVVLIGFFIVFYMEKYDRTVIIYACAVDKYYSTMEPILWDLANAIKLP